MYCGQVKHNTSENKKMKTKVIVNDKVRHKVEGFDNRKSYIDLLFLFYVGK